MSDPLGNYVPDCMKNDEPMREPIAKLAKMIFDTLSMGINNAAVAAPTPIKVSVFATAFGKFFIANFVSCIKCL